MTVRFETCRLLATLPAIRHGFFGRQGGVSDGVFASLNVSDAGGDDPGRVAENRALALDVLGFSPPALATVKQVHSARVMTLTEPPSPGDRPEADALVTDRPGMVLGILTADCTPILFADAGAEVIGAAHAGWKGAVEGVANNTVAAMVALGARRDRIVAAIGPTISAGNYEVGPEFAADFLARRPEAAAFFSTPPGGRAHFDLPGFVAAELRAAGVAAVEDIGHCTYAAPERYFSHRFATHNGIITGRQIALIGRS